MASEAFIKKCRGWYARLLRLYPKAHRERFGEGMQQTFSDLCRERRDSRGLPAFVLWMFAETSAGIVRENLTLLFMQKKSIVRVVTWTGLILLIPLFGNLFVDGWKWGVFDFVMAGALLFGTGMAYELIAQKGGTTAYRVAVGIALAAAFILVWVTLAVEIIGNDNPANLLYGGVLGVGIVGSAMVRFEPRGMARVLAAMALAQIMVPVVALIFWRTNFSPGVAAVFGLNGAFAMLFVVSAMLFRHAGARRA